MQDDMNDFGEIKAQVSNLQTGHEQLRTEIGSVRSEMANLDARTQQGFDKILTRIDSKFESKAQSIWTPLGIAVSALLTLGGWAYSGINEKANVTTARIEKTADHLVETQKEFSFLKGQLHPLDAKK